MDVLCSWAEVKTFSAARYANLQYVSLNGYYLVTASDGPLTLYCRIPISAEPLAESEQYDFERNYKQNCNKILSIERPFADPLFRTKVNACEQIASISPGESSSVDFRMPEELYLYGGNIIIVNPQLGDFIQCSIYDKDSVIPEAYRSAICENWPTVALYIVKQFVEVPAEGTSVKDGLDTRPLIAKITAGLYLRLNYTATQSGIARQVAVNYNLLKKL
jgi:hypothetical protein